MKKHIKTMNTKSFSRRQFLELNLGAAVAAGVGMSPLFGGSAAAGKLRTAVAFSWCWNCPVAMTALTRLCPTLRTNTTARPTIGIQPDAVLKLSDDFGLHPNLLGWERFIRMAKWPLCTDAATPIRIVLISKP